MREEVEKSATAIRFSAAIAQIGLPTLSLAHTPKANADPQHPFGSAFWSNGARVTIAMSGKGERARSLSCRKDNQRRPFAPVQIPWGWPALPDRLDEQTGSGRVADIAWAALGDGPMTQAELSAEIASLGGSVNPRSLDSSLRRRRDLFEPLPGRPTQWCRIEKS